MTYFYKIISRIFILTILLFTAACVDNNNQNNYGNNPPLLPEYTIPLGTGQHKVALLLPFSSQNEKGRLLSLSLRNATQMALEDTDESMITITQYDTQGTAQGARIAAQQALAEGASFILGPVFSAEVKAVRQASAPYAIPVLAFSTDSTAAGGNVLLMSFLPKQSVSRIVEFATSQDKKSIAGLFPQDVYGSLSEAALR